MGGRIKRFLIVIMITGPIAGSVATAEAKKEPRKRVERTVEGSYTSPWGSLTGGCPAEQALGCVSIETRANEAFLTAKAVDAHGKPVLVTVQVPDPNHPPHFVTHGTFCGETKSSMRFPRGVDLRFKVVSWVADLPRLDHELHPSGGDHRDGQRHALESALRPGVRAARSRLFIPTGRFRRPRWVAHQVEPCLRSGGAGVSTIRRNTTPVRGGGRARTCGRSIMSRLL